jgi:hypothetical protein
MAKKKQLAPLLFLAILIITSCKSKSPLDA